MFGFTGNDGDQATGNVSDDPTHMARQPVSKRQLEQSAVGVTETSGMAPKSFYSHSRHGRLLKNPLKTYSTNQGPDLQRILRQTYNGAALTPDLRRACELRAINKKS